LGTVSGDTSCAALNPSVLLNNTSILQFHHSHHPNNGIPA
jgi:hypothetical protein